MGKKILGVILLTLLFTSYFGTWFVINVLAYGWFATIVASGIVLAFCLLFWLAISWVIEG